MKKILIMLLLIYSPAAASSGCPLFWSEKEHSSLFLTLDQGYFKIDGEKYQTIGCGTGISGICGISDKTNEDVFLQESYDGMVYTVNNIEYFHSCDSQ